jgi:hypothetical protein
MVTTEPKLNVPVGGTVAVAVNGPWTNTQVPAATVTLVGETLIGGLTPGCVNVKPNVAGPIPALQTFNRTGRNKKSVNSTSTVPRLALKIAARQPMLGFGFKVNDPAALVVALP